MLFRSPLTNEVAEVEPEIINALTRIVDLECGDGNKLAPRYVALSAEAVEAFERFRQWQHSSKDGLDGREREWWAKGPAHVLRLAGTLSYLSWAMEGGPEPEQIELKFVEAPRASKIKDLDFCPFAGPGREATCSASCPPQGRRPHV